MRVCGLDPSPFLSRHSDVTSRWDVFLITTDNSFADLQRGGNSCPSARRRISHFPLPECKAQTEQDGAAREDKGRQMESCQRCGTRVAPYRSETKWMKRSP